MDALSLARAQFAITTVYHFFFVPLTLGLSFVVAFMESRYVRTNDERYKKMTKFWGKLFLINFAMGVTTGIVQEFQFGMNWSSYARFVGDIFGAPLAVEALLAFFIESTFLGLWIFGWDKLNKKLHAACMWLVAIASSLSALWILIANSFMQNPVGYAIQNGRAEMTDFLALITNRHLFFQFQHVITAGLATAGFFVMGISALSLLAKRSPEFFKKSLKYGMVTSIIGTFLVLGVGHAQGQYLVQEQPMKMAAAEALWETEDPAPFAVVAAIDEQNRQNTFEISIPYMLSFLSYNKFTGEVKGINELQAMFEQEYGAGNYIPPVTVCFWSFRVMVGAGTLMILLSLLAIYFYRTNKLSGKFMKVLGFAIALPYLANTGGWLLTEMGRQPWIVYGLQKVADGVSPSVSAGSVLFSLICFTLIYGVLAAVDVFLLVKYAKKDPDAAPKERAPKEEAVLWI